MTDSHQCLISFAFLTALVVFAGCGSETPSQPTANSVPPGQELEDMISMEDASAPLTPEDMMATLDADSSEDMNTSAPTDMNTTPTPGSGNVARHDGVSTSLVGVLCGATTPTTGAVSSGGFTGERGIKSLCETACGEPEAHSCTKHELAISAQLGLTPEDNAYWINILGGFQCDLWTDGSSGSGATIEWINGQREFIEVDGCENPKPFLCCN